MRAPVPYRLGNLSRPKITLAMPYRIVLLIPYKFWTGFDSAGPLYRGRKKHRGWTHANQW